MPDRCPLYVGLAVVFLFGTSLTGTSSAAVPDTSRTQGCLETVTVLNDADAGAGSLRDAVLAVCAGGTIDFAERFVIDLQSEITIDSNLTIDGSSQATDAATSEDTLVQILGGTDHRSFRVTTGGDLTLRRLRVSGGATTGVGGAIRNAGRLAAHECRFDGNSTGTANGLGGGAIFTDPNSILLVEGSTFDRNDAVRGAAIFNSGQAELRNSTFTDHRGSTNEGAIQNRGTLLASHITVANNGGEGAGFGGLFAFEADTTLVNSIFADNVGHNCFISGGTVVSTALMAESGNCQPQFSDDPALQGLAGRGGVTQTLALASDSIAIDAADAEFCVATDQRGIARPQGEGCDLGAFEVQVVVFDDGFESP